MSQESPTIIARRYIKTQFATMRKYGRGHVHLTREQYWTLVRKVRRPIEMVRRFAREGLHPQP